MNKAMDYFEYSHVAIDSVFRLLWFHEIETCLRFCYPFPYMLTVQHGPHIPLGNPIDNYTIR